MPSNTMTTTRTPIGVRRRLKLLLIVMVMFLSWAAYTYANQYSQLSDRRAELQEANERLAEAIARNEALQLEINRLNDPEYIGQIARKEQGMGLPGEQPIQIKE